MATETALYLPPRMTQSMMPHQGSSGAGSSYTKKEQQQPRVSFRKQHEAGKVSSMSQAKTAVGSGKPSLAVIRPAGAVRPTQRKLAPANLVPIAPDRAVARPLKPLLAKSPSSTAQPSPSANVASPATVSTAKQRCQSPEVSKHDQKRSSNASRGVAEEKNIGPRPGNLVSSIERGQSSATASAPNGHIDPKKGTTAATTAELSPSSSAQSPTSLSDTTSNPSSSTTQAAADDAHIKKDWVLPARAKPGRKPSDIEPPTKRKAQNRASQRAFRERRQSYLASLETKIAEYEQRGASASLEIQRIARRLKEENEALRSENTRLKEHVAFLQNRKSGVPSPPDARSSNAHNVPASEQGQGTTGLPAPTAPKRDAGGDCGFCTREECVCIGEGVLHFPEEDDDSMSKKRKQSLEEEKRSLNAVNLVASGASLPLRRNRKNTRTNVWYTVPNTTTPLTASSARSAFGANSAIVPGIHHHPLSQRTRPDIEVCPTVSRDRWSAFHPMARHLPPFPSHGPSTSTLPPQRPYHVLPRLYQSPDTRTHLSWRHSGEKGIEAPLVSTRKSIWPVYPSVHPSTTTSSMAIRDDIRPSALPSIKSQRPTVFRMQSAKGEALACSGNPKNCAACSSDPALAAFCEAVSTHLEQHSRDHVPQGPVVLDAGNALPLRKRRGHSQSVNLTLHSEDGSIPLRRQVKRTRSGTVVGGEESSRSGCHEAYGEGARGPVSRLWTVSRARERPAWIDHISEAAHPRLGTSQHVQEPTLARRPTIESIPDAWRRIKQHPSFDVWQGQQGGLDLLADVVARRSLDPLATDGDRAHASAQGTPQSQLSLLQRPQGLDASTTPYKRRVQIAESGTRDADSADANRDLSDDGHSSGEDDADHATKKRRRLYVERKSVDKVLAMMDEGQPSAAHALPSYQGKQGLIDSRRADEEERDDGTACACPLSKLM